MTDDDLRHRLGGIDPARDLAPLPPAARTALLERASAGREPARPRLRPGFRILVGAAVGVAAAALFLAVVPQQVTSVAHLLTLSVPDDRTAMCMPVADFAPEALAASTVAFAGTVDSVEGDTVTVAVTDAYRGGPLDVVTLDVPHNIEDATTFTAGEHVLIAAQDGVVGGCGLSGEASPALQQLYDAAF